MKMLAVSLILGAATLLSSGCARTVKGDSTVVHAGGDGYAYSSGEVPDYVVIDSDDGFVASIDNEQATVVVEPEPWTVVVKVPPPRPATVVVTRPVPPYAGAIWVDGYWRYGSSMGFVWVAGHYVPPRVGYVFVAPRWVYRAGHYHHFPGYYRPSTAYVRTHFSPSHYYRPYPHPYYRSPPARHHYSHVSYHGRVSAQPRRHGYPPRPAPVATRPPVAARPLPRTPQTPGARPRPTPSPRLVLPPVSRPAPEQPRVVRPVSRPAPASPRVAPPVRRSTVEHPALPPSRVAAVPPRARQGSQPDRSGTRGPDQFGPQRGSSHSTVAVSRSHPHQAGGPSVRPTVPRPPGQARGQHAHKEAPRVVAPSRQGQSPRGPGPGAVSPGAARSVYRPVGAAARARGPQGPTAARSGGRARP